MSAGRRSARALNVVLYILFIYRADRSVNYVSVCVCASVCILSVSVSVCACPIGGSISWLHCRNAATLKVQKSYLSIYIYIVHISMHARL